MGFDFKQIEFQSLSERRDVVKKKASVGFQGDSEATTAANKSPGCFGIHSLFSFISKALLLQVVSK